MRAAYIIPKTNAELNQVVSVLHSSGYIGNPNVTGAVGQKVTVWFNVRNYTLNTLNYFFHHQEIQPNELYALIHKVK